MPHHRKVRGSAAASVVGVALGRLLGKTRSRGRARRSDQLGAELMRNPTGLTELSLSGCQLQRLYCEALAPARALPNLRRLSVPFNSIDPEGARMLEPSAFPALTDLDLLYQSRITSPSTEVRLGEHLASLPGLGRLRELRLG